jgi:transglutaminase-like putative cysteine protease
VDLAGIQFDLRVNKVIKELSPSGGRTDIEVETDLSLYYSDLQEAVSSLGETVAIEVTVLPLERSPVFFRPSESLRPDSEYTVVAEPLLVGEGTLQSSPSQYPIGITDRYLQIPSTLPFRVSMLASNITYDESNTYDQAVAIETYLRELEYTVASQSIPHDADTVDYFLFESKEGYSDYFASAMAMMLRTKGIPTRLVLGFGPGEPDTEQMGFLVRDKDSHSWPEVYFTNIGWVPFEPTPIYETRPRSLSSPSFGLGGMSLQQLIEEPSDTPDGLLEPEEEKEKRDDFGGPLSGGDGPLALPVRYFGTPLGVGGALFAFFLIMGAVLMRIFWVRQYGGLQSPQGAYERMHRLATFLGAPSAPSQTAFEFSSNLSRLIPEASADVDLVSNTFVRQRYGGMVPSAVEELRLICAWRRIKRALLPNLTNTKEATIPPG